MTFRENLNRDIEKVDKKIDEMSIAYLSIKYAKRDKIAWFVAWLITFIALLCSLIYIQKINEDLGVVTTDTLEIQDVDNINNSHIKIGEDIWEKSN